MSKYSFYSNTYGAQERSIGLVGENRVVLEVGCSTGYVSSRLKKNNCNVYGIELDPEAAVIAREHCEDVLIGDIERMETLPYSPRQFDVILFGDVLEHLRNPDIILKKLKPFLKDNGHIVVTLPNITYWSSRLKIFMGNFEYTDHGILDSTHLRFFNYISAKRLLEENGFMIIKQDFVPPMIFPISTICYFFARLFPNLLAFQFIFVAKKGA
ncbi:MAG: class I SAM-dependent methyltransferase [Candidatus Methanoperedens sp.]|nr:class I SAM-dependent methyltransferase [Candidatus Methanoperedens sp.]